jgi:hypothetical protein
MAAGEIALRSQGGWLGLREFKYSVAPEGMTEFQAAAMDDGRWRLRQLKKRPSLCRKPTKKGLSRAVHFKIRPSIKAGRILRLASELRSAVMDIRAQSNGRVNALRRRVRTLAIGRQDSGEVSCATGASGRCATPYTSAATCQEEGQPEVKVSHDVG